jgi:hypothetical protein
MANSMRKVFASASREAAMPSSVIRSVDYDAEARELRITFLSGRVYAYSGVPQSIYDAYGAATAKGSFFNIAIRGRYRFRELPPAHDRSSGQDRKRSAL